MQTNSADERMWDILARRELNSDEKSSFKDKIKKCITVFDEAVEMLNTPLMWEFYIDALNEIYKDKKVLPNYKRKMLMSALDKGGASGKLGERHYLLWGDELQGVENYKKRVEVMRGAVMRLPESVMLWEALLRTHFSCGKDKAATKVLDAATKVLGSDSLPLWKFMLSFEQLKDNNEVEKFFKKCLAQCPEISGPLGVMYLEKIVMSEGIFVARKAYDVMCEKLSPCLEMHKKMIYIETIQVTLSKKRIVRCYNIACTQFGTTNVDVWMDFYKFQFNNGANEQVIQRIYDRACDYLPPPLRDVFVSECKIFQNIPKGTDKAVIFHDC